MLFYDEPKRDYEFIPGVGGYIAVCHYNAAGQLLPDPLILDVRRYLLACAYINADTTHSGSNGAKLRTRTGADWRFAASLSAPLRSLVGANANEQQINSFVELIVGSSRSVACCFYLGNPAFYTGQGLLPRSYRATRALLDTVEVITDSSGEEVVELEITGSGSSLLWGFVGEVAVPASQWS